MKQEILRQNYLPSTIFTLFRKNSAAKENFENAEKFAADTTDFSRIRCPLCKWQPRASSRWFCAEAGFPEYFFGGCRTDWNTFTTGSECPGCAHQWHWTSCLACAPWSRHRDWYAEKSDK